MGLLLMQFEYQKAKQKCNMLELKGIRLHDKQERYTKRIADIEKLFNKKQTAVESKYTRLQQNANAAISRWSANGASGNILSDIGFSSSIFKEVTGALDNDLTGINNLTAKDGETKTQLLTRQATERASIAAQLQTQLQVILDAFKEAELAELEAAEDKQREPIAEKDAEIQAEVAENDTLMELAKERMEAAKGRLPDTVKNSVAHYGLS